VPETSGTTAGFGAGFGGGKKYVQVAMIATVRTIKSRNRRMST
jgi:hypothetical protein